jgi:uncharacterized protein (TIGR04141 family)
MTSFKLYRLHDPASEKGFAQYVRGAEKINSTEIVREDDFEAQLFWRVTPPSLPAWTPFVMSGFPTVAFSPTYGLAAMLVIRLLDEGSHFALGFGAGGRFLLERGAWRRLYGVRVVLNILYGDEETAPAGRVVALQRKRRGPTTFRSREQATRAVAFDEFNVDRLRDVLDGITGRPTDVDRWGSRVTGSDALLFTTDRAFGELGAICREVDALYTKEDYRLHFSWLDDMQPVVEPSELADLRQAVLAAIKGGDERLDLGPPEVVDWEQVESFRFHSDRRRKVTHPDLRLSEYVASLKPEQVTTLTYEQLRRWEIDALDGDGAVRHAWSVWECLSGELSIDEDIFILDEGEFFRVSQSFLGQLDAYVDGLNATMPLLPPRPITAKREDAYNEFAAQQLGAVLLDKKTVVTSAHTSPVEICDVLLPDAHVLVHVKRHLGSRDLSHLFSQGFVSAQLLQESPEFRRAANSRIADVTSAASKYFSEAAITTSDYTVMYGIAASWRGRGLSEALPFFSRVNLRRTAADLMNRGFGVTVERIEQEG